jgi:hypothetical protein
MVSNYVILNSNDLKRLLGMWQMEASDKDLKALERRSTPQAFKMPLWVCCIAPCL